MNLKEKFSKKYSLYIVLDTTFLEEKKIISLTRICAREKVDFVQLRSKTMETKDFLSLSVKLKSILKNTSTMFVINDRIEIAASLECGLHVGAKDIPLEEATRMLKKNSVLGFTVHTQRELEYANKFPLDYVCCGPVFNTAVKPQLDPQGVEWFLKLKKKSKHRAFAIGGINLKNIDQLIEQDVRDVVILSGFCKSEKPREFLKAARHKLQI